MESKKVKVERFASYFALAFTATVLSIFLWLQAQEVDRLTVEVATLEERETELVMIQEDLQVELSEADDAYKELSAQNGQLSNTLKETQEELTKRTAEYEGRS